MALTSNLGLTVDLPQAETDVPTQFSADNDNFKAIDTWAGTVRKKPTAETFTVNAWSALADKAPFTYSTTVTAATTIEADTLVELINDNALAFAKYGFTIGAVDGQAITVFSVAQPTESVTLRIEIGG